MFRQQKSCIYSYAIWFSDDGSGCWLLGLESSSSVFRFGITCGAHKISTRKPFIFIYLFIEKLYRIRVRYRSRIDNQYSHVPAVHTRLLAVYGFCVHRRVAQPNAERIWVNKNWSNWRAEQTEEQGEKEEVDVEFITCKNNKVLLTFHRKHSERENVRCDKHSLGKYESQA